MGVKGACPLGLPPPLGERGGHPRNFHASLKKLEGISTEPFYLIPFPHGIITRKCIYDEPIIFRNYGAPMKNVSNNLRDDLRVEPGRHIDLLKDYDPGYTGNFVKNEETGEALEQGIRFLAEQQDKLYAQNTYALLIILQALDAAGKDSTIKHVMSGVNPAGGRGHRFQRTQRRRTRP